MTTQTSGQPARPTLEGDTVASVDTRYSVLIDTTGGWSVRVEGDCALHRGSETIDVVDEQFSLLEAALEGWVGAALGPLEHGADGGLVLTCGSATPGPARSPEPMRASTTLPRRAEGGR